MFQTFSSSASPDQGPPRLAALRGAMEAAGLDGFLVPKADRHQGEYVAPCDERLTWLTGFTGSAGFACVLKDVAGVFVDGRYRVQVRAQVADVFTPVDWPEVGLADWLKAQNATGKLGYDPWLHTVREVEALEQALDGRDLALEPVTNLIDPLWADRPDPPAAPVVDYPVSHAGTSSRAKRASAAKTLREAGHRAAILTLPDSICWLLNIRGADIPRIPIVQAFAVLHEDGRVTVYSNPAKFAGLDPDPDITLRDWRDFDGDLAALDGPVRIDPLSCPAAVAQRLDAAGVAVARGDDPCVLPKACKSDVEIEGSREAHLRDGAAMCEFLCWLDAQPAGSLTEIDVVRALEGYRRATNALQDISFETIAGAGPNGAIVHYRVTEETNRGVGDGELLLVDSGGQYLDGTTDITRTIAIGTPPQDAAEAFTRVLQGMIAISRVRFPGGLAGRDLDALARVPLWAAGQDYGHGTGHGVGAYLSVHEGPQRLSRISHVPLQPGMILSNEPGFYLEGRFGIRIENLIVVQPAPDLPGGTVDGMLHFETITWVPIDRRLIRVEMLTRAERDWMDAYHAQVRARIGPRLSDAATAWLDAATAPL
ncbi:aminopeptidase P family protein [Pseudaestuariivita atlantica]|uniref:X-Pro aminopeptidase n=1 Tax=Pseudaestuariivita atlantica TaxID=1317121 RepID=A0A0L1JMA3_9RHOB|nr:aminopeptidase P family protein [Pseudaestuariivita atlantica]KNG92523.1 X-Pro aminopeptidase [Pseudaestuariivita atlantica]